MQEYNIPNSFALVFNLFPDVYLDTKTAYSAYINRITPAMMQLRNRKLTGISGISSTGEILVHWLGRSDRDAALIMDGRATVEANKLTQVLYDNPNYMLSKNGAALSRMLNGANKERMMQSIFMYMNDVFKEYGSKYADLSYIVENVLYVPFCRSMLHKSFTTVSDISNHLVRYIPTVKNQMSERMFEVAKKVSVSEWNVLISKSVTKQSRQFSNEKEWLVGTDEFTIPMGSTLYLPKPDGYNDVLNLIGDDPLKWTNKNLGEASGSGMIIRFVRYVGMMKSIKRLGLDLTYKIKEGIEMSEIESRRQKVLYKQFEVK